MGVIMQSLDWRGDNDLNAPSDIVTNQDGWG